MRKGKESDVFISSSHPAVSVSGTVSGMKKASLLVLFLLLSIPSLFSSSLIWKWSIDDPEIAFFRYQKNREKSSGWTVVDSSVTEVVLPFTGDDRLFIQSSYDGIVWSESGSERYSRFPECGLALTAVPYSTAFYLFYNGFGTTSTRTATRSGYGLSSEIEFDLSLYRWLRIHLDGGCSLQVKKETVIPGEKSVRYIKGGLGADFTLILTGETMLYMGLDGGIMMHINNSRYSLSPYFGGRIGGEYELSTNFRIGMETGAALSFLLSGEKLNDSLTILVDCIGIRLAYIF